MNIFFTADTHFGHEAIRRHCNRPFESIEAMDAHLVAAWNERVGSKDTVYILGDFAWARHASYLARLKGKKILIRGNHDKMPQTALRNFTQVHDLLFKTIERRPLMLCHYCMLVWHSSCHGAWHLYGHSHGRVRETPETPRCDVGVDVWDFRPVPWEAIKLKLEGRQKTPGADIADLDANVETNRTENRHIMQRVG